MQQIQTYAAPVGRFLLAFIFIFAGFGKIAGYAGTAAYMDMMGVPGALLPLVIITELLGGIALAIGWQARWVALALAGFSILSGFIFHYLPSLGMEGMDATNQLNSFLKNVSIAGGMLMVFALGAGPVAVDTRSPNAVPAE